MTVLVSRGGYVTVTTRYDRAAFVDDALWAQCLLRGFDEILALGGEGRTVPASFAAPETRSSNGSAAQ